MRELRVFLPSARGSLVDEIVGPDTLALTVSGAGAMIKDVI
jgi:hypothetical protein